MKEKTVLNVNRVKLTYLYLPLILLLIITIYIYLNDAFSINSYIEIQKEAFFYLNFELAKFPLIQYNLTQLGDAFIFLSLLTPLLVYIPKLWEALISASIISGLICSPLKWLFKVPRPASAFHENSFVIIGKAYYGSNSLPSGHSITIFTFLTVVLLVLMPADKYFKLLWTSFIVCLGIILCLTRVAVGAHFLLDVLFGSIIGYISGILGILFIKRYGMWNWIGKGENYPLFIALFFGSIVFGIFKIVNSNLFIFYFSCLSLFVSSFILLMRYIKR